MTEAKIMDNVKLFMEIRSWTVLRMHCNAYQKGIPDLWACHPSYGPRWVEIKKPEKYKFTKDQLKVFPKIEKSGAGIWILNAGTMDEYRKLFFPHNWKDYLHGKILA